MKAGRLAKRYAKVLVDLAYERGAAVEVRRDTAALLSASEMLPPLLAYLSDPKRDTEERKAAAERLAADLGLGPLTRDFLRLLVERRRCELLPEIAAQFEEMAERRDGIVRIRVESATELSEDEKRRLAESFGRIAGGKPKARFEVTPELIGGVRVEVKNVVYDNSIAARLETLRNRLIGG